jgi:FkbM family methyltransferase
MTVRLLKKFFFSSFFFAKLKNVSKLILGDGINFGAYSYSQCGEDMIIAFIFSVLKKDLPTYIDIGAHHPYRLSNTAHFYQKGCHGINIEPDPVLFRQFKISRSRDINLNIGIRCFEGEACFYIMSSSVMNTFSRDVAEQLVQEHGFKLKKTQHIYVNTISNVITNYAGGVFPDFLSLDVEGLDMEILESIDYSTSYPLVICVESISFSRRGNGEKNLKIVQFLENKGYMVFADTHVNTIFVHRSHWIK